MLAEKDFGGGSWIRTNVGARPTDLQSALINHSSIPPKANCELCRLFKSLSNGVAVYLPILAIFMENLGFWADFLIKNRPFIGLGSKLSP